MVFLYSCQEDSWSDEEKSIFVHHCQDEGGSEDYCECYMKKTMEEYPRYEESHNISFEEAVELSKDCK